MNRKHALLISVVIGAAAIAGTVAATKTVKLGRHAARAMTPASLIAQRRHALDRTQVALKKALQQRPPKLPPLPAKAPVAAGAAAGFARAPAQRVVYVRPAPIIRHVHRPGGEHEGGDGHESDGGSQSGSGGGFDD